MNFKHITLGYMREMSAGDRDTELEMLQLLLIDLEKEVPELTRLIAAMDSVGIKRTSHHLKSSFAFTGNNTLTQNIKLIEAAAQSGKINDSLRARWQEILKELPKVVQELRLLQDHLRR